MKALQIIESAYRCNIEEQDDPIVWIAQVFYNLEKSSDILLRGNAVNYLVSGQDASGLVFGDKTQAHPPKLDQDLTNALSTGIKIYAITEDLQNRGIAQGKLINGVEEISRHQLPELFEQYDQVWHW